MHIQQFQIDLIVSSFRIVIYWPQMVGAVLIAILLLWKRPVPIVSDMYLSYIVPGFSILSVDTRFSTCGEWGRHSFWPHLHWWWEITTFNLVFTLLPHHPISTMHSLFPHLSNWVFLGMLPLLALQLCTVCSCRNGEPHSDYFLVNFM